jgi:hypothetical protein
MPFGDKKSQESENIFFNMLNVSELKRRHFLPFWRELYVVGFGHGFTRTANYIPR